MNITDEIKRARNCGISESELKYLHTLVDNWSKEEGSIIQMKRDGSLDNIMPISSSELDNKDIPKKKILLSPWLKEKEIAMIYAPPGTGKTFFALNCAYSLVSGKKFLKFDAANPVDSLLYVDAEMDEGELQERWRMICKKDHFDGIKFYTPSLFMGNSVPLISSIDGQRFYSNKIKEYGFKVVIFDNISMLTDFDENKANEWNIVQRWLVQLKNIGVSVILIHHTNKGKKEHRGTSKIADTLNSIIFLEEFEDDQNFHSVRFKVNYIKKRNFYGEDAEKFEASLDSSGRWIFADTKNSNREKVISDYKMGMKPQEIASELSINIRTVYRYQDDAEASGMIKKRNYGR